MTRFAEVAALVLVTWPFACTCASPAFWRTFPHEMVRLAGLLVAYALAVTASAVWLPQALGPLALAASGGLAWQLWRARPQHGRARRWPPGSLALMPVRAWTDHLYFQELAARHGPVFKTSHFLRPMVCVLGLERGHELLRRHDRSLLAPPLPFSRYIPAGFLRHMTHADHGVYRALFRRVFAPEVHEAQAEATRRTLAEGLAAMASADAGVRTKPWLARTLFVVWMRLFFGLGPDDGNFARLKRCYKVLDLRNPLWASERRRVAAIEEACAILRSLEAPSWTYLARMRDAQPGALEDDNALRNLFFVLHTSWSDIAALLQWTWKMMADHPEWLERLRAAESTTPSLARRCALETLRLEQSEHLYRVTLQAIEFEGLVIPRGWLVRVLVRESHRLPAAHQDAEVFNPDRFLQPVHAYAPFGTQRHACLGEELTLSTAEMFLQELGRGFDWAVEDDGPRVMSRWRHWAPSARFRVRLRPREVAK